MRAMVGTWCRAREVATAVTRGERRLERPAADPRAGSKSREPEARLGQHLRIDVESFHGADAVMCQQRVGQGARSRAEVQHQGWTGTGDFARGSGQGLFVAWDERADGRIVRITLQAQMLADDVAHPLIVGRGVIDVHGQRFNSGYVVTTAS